jgi:hypothetical protein
MKIRVKAYLNVSGTNGGSKGALPPLRGFGGSASERSGVQGVAAPGGVQKGEPQAGVELSIIHFVYLR